MDYLQTRPYEPTDAGGVADMFNRVDGVAGRPPALTASLVEDFLTARIGQPATDSRVVLAGDEVVAAGFVVTPPEGGDHVDLPGGVVPAARGRGIGRDLLGWQLQRAAEIHATVAAGTPWTAHTEVGQADAPALALYARYGLAPVRYAFDMVAPIAGVAELPVPEGLVFAAYQPERARAVHAAHTDAFADHWGFQPRPFPAWAPMTVEGVNFNPSLSVLAMDGPEIAGYVLAYDDAIAGRVYVGQVGVRQPWRRRGLATAMLSHVMRAAGGVGRTSAALDVDAANPTGAVGVYERVGFETVSRMVTYSRALG